MSGRCTSTSPAASMPAGTITSATSAFSASRRTGRSITRSRSAAAPTTAPSSARFLVRRCPMPRLPTSSRTSPPPISSCARDRASFSSIPSSASASIPSGSAFMPLVKAGRIVEDRFVRVVDDAPIPDGAAAILPAARFLADARDLVLRQAPTGVVWPNDRKVAELAPYLDWIALVALVFPNFRDGRGYSQARILRERYHFRGELRATGQILRDQFLFLHRAGFDAFEVTKSADAPAFIKAMATYSVFYQPPGDGLPTAADRRLFKMPAGIREIEP